MSTPYEIPLAAQNQQFTIALAGVTYTLKFRWCAPATAWTLNISDQLGNPIVSGLQVVTGADLLEQFAYLGIGGALVAQSDFDPLAVPTYANLGTTGHLFFVTP